MAELHISPAARNDLQGIQEYISTELDNPAVAIDTVTKIIGTMRRLKDFPSMGARLSSLVDGQADYRFFVSGSYLVFYRYEDHQVYVVRVIYGKQGYLKIPFGSLLEG